MCESNKRVCHFFQGLMMLALGVLMSGWSSATVSTSYKEAELRAVLLQLAETAGINILLAESVQGRVSLNVQAGQPRAARV